MYLLCLVKELKLTPKKSASQWDENNAINQSELEAVRRV